MNFDVKQARLSKKAEFKPFLVETFLDHKVLSDKGFIKKEEGLLVFKDKTNHYGFLTKQMTYHHVANGDIDGEAFMVSF